MKRITPEMVLDSYKKTGFRAVRGDYIDIDEFQPCGLCGLAVVAVAECGLHWLTLKSIGDDSERFDEIVKALEIDEDYALDFIDGFDGDDDDSSPEPHVKSDAWLDGMAAAAAVFPFPTP